jgi:probable F420-dependent oxidoreductase
MWTEEQIGKVGIWSAHFRHPDRERSAEYAHLLEELGFRAVWVPGGAGDDIFGDIEVGLRNTTRTVWAAAILNVWMHEPAETASWFARMQEEYPGRVILGLGASHPGVVGSRGKTYDKPLSTVRAYIDDLEKQPRPVPKDMMVLAALGPKMLALSAERTAGAHPYLVTPEHTAHARATLGDGALLAPEVKVLLAEDAESARRIARDHLELYLSFPNYLRNFERLGFSEADFRDGGSDRLVDAMVAWGDEAAILDKVRAHLDAGADHVCMQILTPASDPDQPVAVGAESPVDSWKRLAAAMPADLR